MTQARDGTAAEVQELKAEVRELTEQNVRTQTSVETLSAKIDELSIPPPTRQPIDTPADVVGRPSSNGLVLVRLVLSNGTGHATGFLISDDGFVLTAYHACRWPKWLDGCDWSVTTRKDDETVACDHVRDFEALGVSLVRLRLAEGNKTPFFLAPVDAIDKPGDAVTLLDFSRQTCFWALVAMAVGGRIVTLDPPLVAFEYDSPVDEAVGKRNSADMRGGPVVSARHDAAPQQFCGITLGVVREPRQLGEGTGGSGLGEARFLPITSSSLLWTAVQQAMASYRA